MKAHLTKAEAKVVISALQHQEEKYITVAEELGMDFNDIKPFVESQKTCKDIRNRLEWGLRHEPGA